MSCDVMRLLLASVAPNERESMVLDVLSTERNSVPINLEPETWRRCQGCSYRPRDTFLGLIDWHELNFG